MRFALSLIAALLLPGVAPAREAAAQPVVTVESGALAGRSESGIAVFRGIPFAAPPVGALRWRPPQPARAWQGTRDASRFAPPCPQPPMPGLTDGLPPGSEDCLMLNVWTPDIAARKLPVMVWIHGGGHAVGASSERYYDGAAFARRGVVLVSIAYRLGRLGFFAPPALLQEAAARGEPAGNYGMMDQIAALKWVKRNIAAFGGDPDRVTIFGESGGGRSVTWLMTSPAATGLFVGAIAQSGRAMEPLRGMTSARYGMPAMSAIDAQVAQALRAPTMDALRRLPAATFIPGYGQLMREGFGPFIDGQIITGDPATLFAQGKQHNLPFLLGVNSWEGNLFMASYPSLGDFLGRLGPWRARAEQLYGVGARPEAQVLTDLFQDAVYNSTIRVLGRRMASVPSPVFAYYFDYVTPFKRGDVPGAAHGAEIPYVFDSYHHARQRDRYGPTDRQMAELMQAYWVAFARTGDPNGDGRPVWPRYRPGDDQVLVFADRTAPASWRDNPRLMLHEERLNTLYPVPQRAP